MSKNGYFQIAYNPPLELKNIIIWHDGVIRPLRGHNQCTGMWRYDGQVFAHNCAPNQSIKEK